MKSAKDKSAEAKQVVPPNELWLHTPEMSQKLTHAIQWAEENPSKATDLDAIERKIKKRR